MSGQCCIDVENDEKYLIWTTNATNHVFHWSHLSTKLVSCATPISDWGVWHARLRPNLVLPCVTVEPLTMDSLYYGNLHNTDKRPQSWIIPYSSLYIATSVYLPTPNYGHAPKDKINANFPLKVDSLDLHVEKYLLFFKSLAISIHSSNVLRPLCTQGVLNFRTRGIQQLERVITLSGALSV